MQLYAAQRMVHIRCAMGPCGHAAMLCTHNKRSSMCAVPSLHGRAAMLPALHAFSRESRHFHQRRMQLHAAQQPTTLVRSQPCDLHSQGAQLHHVVDALDAAQAIVLQV